MSEHKFKVGDKAYYIMPASKKKRLVTILEVAPKLLSGRSWKDYKIQFDDRGTWDYAEKSELEPVSDEPEAGDTVVYKGEEYKLGKTEGMRLTADFVKDFMKRVEAGEYDRPNSDNILPQEEIEALMKEENKQIDEAMHILDDMSRADNKQEYQRGYKDGMEEGYKIGMNAVIINLERFLREIKP